MADLTGTIFKRYKDGRVEQAEVSVKWRGENLFVRRVEGMWSITHIRTGYEVFSTSRRYAEILPLIKGLDANKELWDFGSLGKIGEDREDSTQRLKTIAGAIIDSGLALTKTRNGTVAA